MTLAARVDFGDSWTRMLRLSFHVKPAAEAVLEVADLRVTGGSLWHSVQHRLIATYSDGYWKHRGRRYRAIAVTGGGCLLFGITRDPTIVSEPIDHFYFIGPTLSANGVAIAKYVEQQEMWHGTVRPMWWMGMRIVSAATVSSLLEDSNVVLLNPWEPVPNQGGIPSPVLGDRAEISDSSTDNRPRVVSR